MGNPFDNKAPDKSPFSKPGEDIATKERQKEHAEKANKRKEPTFKDFEKKAEKVKSDPNERAAQVIRQLDGKKETVKQLEGLTALNQALISILTKLAKEDVEIEKIKTPKQLQDAVTKTGIKLSLPEAAAIENLNEVAGVSGPTATEIKNSWPDRIETAQEASKSFGDKYKEHFKKNPGATIALTFAGAAGVYLTYQGIKGLVKKAFGDPEKDKDEKGSWFKKEIAIPLAIMAAGGILGKDVVKKMVKDAGLDYFDLEDKVKKGEELAGDQKKKAKKLADKIQKKLDEKRDEKDEHKPSAGGYVEPEPVPGALEPDTKKPETVEAKPAELETFGDKLLVDAGSEKLADGTYLFMTGKTKTYYRFHNEKWEWASVRQKKADEWVATGGDYYGDKEKYAKANELSELLGKGPEGIAAEKKEAREKTKEDIERIVSFEGPRDLLIKINCYNEFEYSENDILQIRNSIETFRGKNVGEVISLWNEYKNKKTIPSKNSLGNFEDGIEGKNIYTAVRIIAATAEEYQKRGKLDYSKITVEDFLRKHLSNDPVHKVHNSVQESIIKSIQEGGITDILSMNDVNIEGLDKKLEEMSKDAWVDLAKDFGIETDEIKRADFTIMLAHLQQNATLKMDAETAMSHADFPKSDEKTTAAVKTFYTKVRENTLKKIFPAAIERFNLGKEDVNNKENADILKNHLNDSIGFKRGVYLCLVTRQVDLSKPADQGSSGPQEMAFLFTLLSSLPKEQKTRYMSELTVLLTKQPDKFPSLKLIQPYFEKVANFGIDYVKNKAHAAWLWVSALMPNRSDEERAAFLKEVRNKSFMQFGGDVIREGTGGSLAVAKEFIVPFINSGKVTLEQISHCEDPLDFMALVVEAGGTFLYKKDENGQPHGMIHFLGDTFVFRPAGIIKESFDSALDGDPVGGMKVWAVGSMPFVTFGAAHGYYMAYISKGGWRTGSKAWGAAKGAARGLAYPYYALRTSYRTAKYTASAVINAPAAIGEYVSRPGQAVRKYGRGAADFLKYRSPWPGQNVPNMLENGRRFKHYFEASDLTEMNLREILHNLKNNKKLMFQRLSKNFNNRMALRYAMRFADDYNAFFNFDKASDQRIFVGEMLKGNKSEIGKAMSRYQRVSEFLQNTDQFSSIFEEMKTLAKSGKGGDELSSAMTKLIQKMKFGENILNADEAKALAKQLLSEKDVINLQKRMKSGLEAFSEGVEAAKPASRTAMVAKLKQKFGPHLEKLKEGVGKKVGDIKEGIKESRRAPTHLESTRSFGKTSEALKTTEKQLKETRKMAKAAEEEIGLLNRMRSGGGQKVAEKLGLTPAGKYSGEYSPSALAKRYEQARKIAQDARAAEKKLETSMDALRQVKQAEDAIATAGDTAAASGKGSKLLKDLLRAEEAAEEALEVSAKASSNIGKLGKFGTALKWGGRGLGIAGAVFSAYELQASFREAWSTDIADRKSLKYAESGLWAANLVADGAAVAVMYGAGGTAATYASAAALPLIPITYAATTMGGVAYEQTKTDYEWAQANPYETLHHFYTSVNSISLGDAWIGGFKAIGRSPVQLAMTMTGASAVAPVSWETKGQKEAWDKSYAESVKTKVSTMHKIYRGLVAMQNDPGLLSDINTMEPGKKKDSAIEARIKKNYSKYHEFYFRNLWPNQMTSYEQAQKFIMDAQMFHEIMTMRDRVREKGGQLTLTGDNDLLFNLHKDRYEILGGIENPHAKVDFRPDLVVKAYKKNLLTAFKRNEVMWSNLERMDTAYLARICAQIRMKVSDPAMKEKMEKDGLGEALSREYRCIETYLKAHRGVNLNFAVGNAAFREPAWSIEGLQKHIEGLGSFENKSYTDFEVSERNMTVAVHAMYKFAEYFGYTGEPTEAGLKEFLNEASAKYHGIYWDGSGWYLQERGAEFDDFMGKALTTAMITKMIKRMREQPDNILEHRQDTVFVDAYDYSYEVKGKMAVALQKGLEEGEMRGYKGEKREAKLKSGDDYVVPPAEFKVDKPDYNLEASALKEGYKKAIDDIKRQTLWTNLDYEIEDEKYIKLKRKDGSATMWLTRHGKTWEVGSKGPDVCRGLTLTQAVALGNLVNWARQWIKKEKLSPDGSNPFEIDGQTIEYNKNMSWINTTFMSHWNEFYGKIGLSQKKCVEVLNAFF